MSATEINPNQVINAICHEFSKKIDIAAAFVWLHYKLHNEKCNIKQINYYFEQAQLSKYNPTRLNEDLIKNSGIIAERGTYMPNRKLMSVLDETFAPYFDREEEVICENPSGIILPTSIYKGSSAYIKCIGDQINASYEHSIYDGCAILMRRLLEVLLLSNYTKRGLISSSDNEYHTLSSIIKDIENNNPFNFSKEEIGTINHIRILGNISAHKYRNTAIRNDILKLKSEYRYIIQTLLYIYSE